MTSGSARSGPETSATRSRPTRPQTGSAAWTATSSSTPAPDHRARHHNMASLESWWWPKRLARVPGALAAGLLTGLGAVLFGVSAVVLRAGAVGWDLSLFRVLNEVPAAAASVLTPLSRLFLPGSIITVIVLTVVYVVARNRSVLPVLTGAVAAGA